MNPEFATFDLTRFYILVYYEVQIDFVRKNNQNEYCYQKGKCIAPVIIR